MATAEATADCLALQDAQAYVLASFVFAAFGASTNVVTIFLIVWTRAYRQHVHRLTLYLAILGLFFSAAMGIEVIPVDTDGSLNSSRVSLKKGPQWQSACAAIGFAVEHLAFSRSLATLSVCFYIFVLAVFDVKLNRIAQEITGVVLVLFLPTLLSWIPFLNDSYGLTGAWCWIKDDSCDNNVSSTLTFGRKLQLGMAALDVVPSAISLSLIVGVGVIFCHRALRMPEYVRKQHWRALKEIFPLSCYPFCLGATVLWLGITRMTEGGYTNLMVEVALLQTLPLVLLLSFLSHSSVRRSCTVRLKCPLAAAHGIQEGGERGAAAAGRSHIRGSTKPRDHTETDSLITRTSLV